MVRLVLVDDHPVVRAGIGEALSDHAGFDVVGEHNSGEEALAALKRERPGVLVMDQQLDGMDGIAATAMVRERDIDCRVVMFTSFHNESTIIGAFRAGADGFVVKISDPTTLITAIEHVLAGGTYIDPGVVGRLVSLALAGRRMRGPHGLSVAERRVLERVPGGGSAGQIGMQLGLAAGTVKSHRTRALGKLGMLNRPQHSGLGRAPVGVDVMVIMANEMEREGAVASLSERPGMLVTASVGSIAHARAEMGLDEPDVVALDPVTPDVIVMELHLPGLSGAAGIVDIVEAAPETQVVVLAEHASSPIVLSVFGAGARGIVLKDSDPRILDEAVRSVAAGGMFVDPRAATALIDLAATGGKVHNPDGLTRQQLRVLTLLSSGLTNKQIGAEMRLKESTIKSHVDELRDKLGVRKRAELARIAIERGYA